MSFPSPIAWGAETSGTLANQTDLQVEPIFDTPHVLQASAADERLEKAHLDFPGTLEDDLTTLAIGLHARAAG